MSLQFKHYRKFTVFFNKNVLNIFEKPKLKGVYCVYRYVSFSQTYLPFVSKNNYHDLHYSWYRINKKNVRAKESVWENIVFHKKTWVFELNKTVVLNILKYKTHWHWFILKKSYNMQG